MAKSINKTAGKKRLDTQLESEGAEFLVLGNLLVEGILAFKTYHNFTGIDLVAKDRKGNRSVDIQVKSRYYTDWSGFIIRNLNCDFVVLVILNRGYKKPKRNGDIGRKDPDFYVLPISYLKQREHTRSTIGRISKSRLNELSAYKDRWDLIRNKIMA